MHEVMAALMAFRLGRDPNTFSFAYNDYGFELLSAKPVVLTPDIVRTVLSVDILDDDIFKAVASGTMPRRQFRSIAAIAGLIQTGRPGKPQSTRHLQASSEMIYDVFQEYDPLNQLLEQAKHEVLAQVIDIERLQRSLTRIADMEILLMEPQRTTPLAFPIMVDRLRERLSTEKLADRINRLRQELERYATKV